MDHQLARLYECFVAMRARVRSLARVDPSVAMKLPRMFEGSATDAAPVRPLFGVDPSMHLQILLNTEHLVAVLTLEGSFTRVGPIVADEPGGHGESFVADIAAMGISGYAVRTGVSS